MTVSDQQLSVHRSVTVPLTQDRAFALFTARQHEFWPRTHSISSSPRADAVVEPRAGGRWFERGVDGSECEWGRVLTWRPPDVVVLIWQVGADWTHHPELETEVEVRFTEVEPGRTRVDLTHHHLERFGEHAEQMRTVFESPNAWTAILDAYLDSAGAAA